jgi:ribosome-associated translation inhibitor RaiA
MKRILVVGDESISRQARTYAEYRVFSALTGHTRRFSSARVLLGERDVANACDKVLCDVTVALEPSGSVRVRVRGPHPYAAINRAVERLGDIMARDAERSRVSAPAAESIR